MQVAAKIWQLLGKGLLWLSLNVGTYFEAYKAPHFEKNIPAVKLLTKLFNVIFSDFFQRNRCFMISNSYLGI